MRILSVVAATVTVLAVAAPAAQASTTPTADLTLSRLSFSVTGNTVTVTAVARNLGPNKAQPAVDVKVWGGTVVSTMCTFNKQQYPDSADGSTCEVAPRMLNGTAGMILKVHVQRPTILQASASVYDLDGATDPVSSNNSRYRQMHLR